MYPSQSVFTAINSIITLFKWLIEARDTNKKTRFEKCFSPLYDALVVVHRDYISMFNTVIINMPSQWRSNPEYNNEDNIPDDIKERLIELRNQLSDQRKINRGERDALRQDAEKYLAKAVSVEEKRFVCSIILYFIENEPATDDISFIDDLIKSIESQEYSRDVLRTPSEKVIVDLIETNSPVIYEKILNEAIVIADRRFVITAGLHTDLKIKTYS